MDFSIPTYDDYSEDKKKIKVIIFGPYAKMSKLIALKQFLIKDGYEKTNLVEHLPNPDGLDDGKMSDKEFSSKKSKFYLGTSDVNLFVLFKDVSHGSVTVEMEHFLTKYPECIFCASFLFEKGVFLESIEEGTLEENKCYVMEFEDDDNLFELSKKECWNHVTGNCLKK